MGLLGHADGYLEAFAAVPTPCMIIGRDLRILDMNDAYLRMVDRRREDVTGQHMFVAFPDDPGDPRGSRAIEASVRRVLAGGRPDRMPLLRYDVEVEPGSGAREERWWTILHVPVLDADGTVSLVLNTAQDVTEVVRSREHARREQALAEDLLERTRALEADLFAHARELASTAAAEAIASRRLTGLAEVALELAGTETLQDLVEVVFGSGLSALGAAGGAVGVQDDSGRVLRLTMTTSLGARAQRSYAELPMDGPLPGPVAARTGRPVLLGDREAGLAFTPEMAAVYTDPGQVAWAALPLRVGPRILGSVIVGWDDPQDFTPGDVELLGAFAAQCAQALDRLVARQVERTAATAARRWSEALQRSLLTDPPALEHFDVTVRYQPAARETQVGGDWYDAFVGPDGTVTLVVGDVAGHDRDAAAEMAQVRNVLRGVAQALRGRPARILSALDEAMQALGDLSPATAVVCQVEAGVGPRTDRHGSAAPGAVRLRWSNAGHPPPLLVGPEGAVRLLERTPDLMLGVDAGTDRADHEVELPAGSTLVLYTDGLVERRGQALDEGLARLQHAAAGLHAVSAGEVGDALLERLAGDAEDDVALLVLRPHPVPSPPAGDGALLGLAPHPSSVRRARTFVQERCASHDLDEGARETAVLLTSEVVTNAVVHGVGDVRLLVAVRPGRVRVEVGDDDGRHPRRGGRDPEALGGRGLEILDLLAADWGVRDEARGKTVWFEVAQHS